MIRRTAHRAAVCSGSRRIRRPISTISRSSRRSLYRFSARSFWSFSSPAGRGSGEGRFSRLGWNEDIVGSECRESSTHTLDPPIVLGLLGDGCRSDWVEPVGCPSAVTARVTDKRLLTRRPDPCRGIVGRRVVPLSRSAPNAGLSRRDPYGVLSRLASRIIGQRDLTLEREDQGTPAG